MLGELSPNHRWFPSPVAIVRWLAYLAVPCAVWLTLNYQALRERFAAEALLNKNKREVSELEMEAARLREEKLQLEKGGFPAEKAIRERYKMALPDEHVIYIEPDPSELRLLPQAEGPAASPDAEAEEDSDILPALDEPPPETPIEDDLPPIE